MNGTGRHVAEAAGAAVAASGYYWLTLVEEPLRLTLLMLGVVLTVMQIGLALRSWRRGKRR